jgi:hypothetical protein
MPMGQFEQRILNLERAVMRLFVELGRLLARLAGLEQSNWQAWGSVGGGTSAGIQITQAILNTPLASGTLASPTTASAVLYAYDGSNWVAGDSVTVVNSWPLSAAVDAGLQISVYEQNGAWHAVQRQCP